MITYKSVWYGNEIIKVPTMYSSSQTCSSCGYKNSLVKNLAVRIWECQHKLSDKVYKLFEGTIIIKDNIGLFYSN